MQAAIGPLAGHVHSQHWADVSAHQAHIVAFNAQIVAARPGASGREFSVVAGELSRITSKIDELVREALRASAA